MDKKTLRQWEKYIKWIDEQNKPVQEINKNQWLALIKYHNKKVKKYEKELKSWEKRRTKRIKEIKLWRSQPWYKKIGEEPTISYMLVHGRPFYPSMPFFIPHPIKKPTWEDFLNWCIKK